MSIEERQWLIIIYICISNEFITINKLMELVDVSHNTILNDLNNIRELIEFEQFNIHLRVKKFGGYYIECHLLSKIQFIYKILHEIHKSSSEAFKSLIHEKLLSNTSFSHYHSLEKTDFLKTLLKEISNDAGEEEIDKAKRDERGYGRYYKTPIKAYGRTYLLVSQWVENQHRKYFSKWIETLKK